MMHHSEAMIEHGYAMMGPSYGEIDHSSGVMHQSFALIDRFSAKNDAMLCNNNRSWLRHDARLTVKQI